MLIQSVLNVGPSTGRLRDGTLGRSRMLDESLRPSLADD